MTQDNLNRSVAQATGEDLQTIAARGFTLLTEDACPQDDRVPMVVDWDELELERYLSMCG